MQLRWMRKAKPYVTEFLRTLKNPMKVQNEVLFSLLNRNKNTVYGKRYGFSKIKSINEFQKRVPVIEYTDILPYIKRLKNGEQNILTKKEVVYFCTTSGSTSVPKLIPVTRDRVKNFRREFALWSWYVLRRYPQILRGKTLYFAGPYDEGRTSSGIMYGSISGYLANKTPWMIKNKLVIPPHIYNIMDFDKKTKEIALLALRSNITQLAFAAPIEAILFLDYIKDNKEDLLDELEYRGFKRVAKKLRKKEFTPSELWPKLGLIGCIKSDMQIAYLETLKQKIGKKIPIRDPGIYASEGRLTIGLEKGEKPIGSLLANVNFYEFCERDGDDFKDPVTIDKLKRGRQYLVIITTPEGLYRYNMGDVLEVVGFKNKLPLVRFVNRNSFLNMVGELSPENELVAAFQRTAKTLKIDYSSFTFLPYLKELKKRPRYELLIEPNKPLTDTLAKKFLLRLDKELQKTINDYRQMRNEFGRLGSPVLSVLKKGSYDSYNKKRIVSSGQPKPIHLSRDSKFRKNFKIEKTYK